MAIVFLGSICRDMSLGKTFGLGLSALALVACSTTPAPVRQPTQPRPPINQPVPQAEEPIEAETAPEIEEEIVKAIKPEPGEPVRVTRDGLTPPHMQGRDLKRLALLLPFSAKSERLRAEANSMLKAAELAIFDREQSDVVLVPLDTQGTDRGARNAASVAARSGVDVILGPVLSGSVRGASQEVRRASIPLIAFSTDLKVAGNGTYLLSFPPEAEVDRIVDYAASTGVTRFAILGPDSEYGRRVAAQYAASIEAVGGEITASESYKGNDISVMQGPAKKLAQAFEAQDLATNGQGPMAFEAIMLPEGGTPLRSLAPLLPYFYDGAADAQFLGTSRWQNEDTAREPALKDGVFAGPDEASRKAFQDHYDRSYGEDPSRLASLAYDAVNVGAVIADGDPKTRRQRAEDGAGFYGADGFVRFGPDGKPDRGLAVFQIRNGRYQILEPAPKTGADMDALENGPS